MRAILIAAAGCGLVSISLGGCTTYRETQPGETATQQLLESHAAELAAVKLADALPVRSDVYVDGSHFKGDGSDYALSAIRAACMRRGLTLAPEQKGSKVTVEVRVGALSIDQMDTVLGLPALALPVPGMLTAVPIPEVSLYSSSNRIGKAEFSAIAYDTATRAPIALIGPVGAQRKLVQQRYLTFIVIGRKLEPVGVIDKK